MLLGAVFLGGGATLAALRKRAAHSNECDDFPECDQPSGLAKSCCSSTASLTGVLEAAEAAEAAASEEETTCKFCDATASCRFCFAGPERGELIAPCACVGSQVRNTLSPRFFLGCDANRTIARFVFLTKTPPTPAFAPPPRTSSVDLFLTNVKNLP
jgi:hypothetical protein